MECGRRVSFNVEIELRQWMSPGVEYEVEGKSGPCRAIRRASLLHYLTYRGYTTPQEAKSDHTIVGDKEDRKCPN
jgi:hypothetical protein